MRTRRNLEKARQGRAGRGFNLVELMITVAIMTILLAVAVPAYQDAVLASKLRGYANSLVASVYLARGEAIKRNSQVTLCVSADGSTCAAGGWEQGWIVLAGTAVIHRQAPLDTGFHGNGTLATATFQPSGVGATAMTVTFCRQLPSVGDQERVVTVGANGRPAVTHTATRTCV